MIEIQSVHPIIKKWLTKDWIESKLRENLAKEFIRISDIQFGASFQNNCPFKNATVEDYLYQVIDIDKDKKVVASIRFKSLDLIKPFVEIVTKNFLVESENDWVKIAQIVADKYAVFQVKCIRFYDGLDQVSNKNNGFVTDQLYIAGQIEAIKLMPKPPGYAELKLVKPSNLEFYPLYEKAYKQLEVKANGEELTYSKETKAFFQELIDNHEIYSAYLNNNWIGLIAAMKASPIYFKGYVIQEEILLEAYKGLGMGKVLQRKLIDMLNNETNDLIFGTIDNRNIASIKTALANGRHRIGKFVFYNLKQF